MSTCTCPDCTNRHRPSREEMTRLEGDDTREIRAAVVGHVLLVYAFDRYDARDAGPDDWHPDPESGVALSPEGLAALRALLGLSPGDNGAR